MARLILAVVVAIVAMVAAMVPAGASASAAAKGDIRPHLHETHTDTGGWAPDVRAAKRFARGRAGDVRFAFIDPYGRSHALNATRTAPMASLFKALLLATYLSRPGVRGRSLHGWERDLLGPMITRSDNNAATRLRDMLGSGPIISMARKAGMQDFSYHPTWGLSRTSSRDQARFFVRWDRFVPDRHERYTRYLLSHVVSSQRWGVGRARPRGWDLFFKGGWGVGSGRVNHQTAFYERAHCRAALAVMTEYSPGHHYGTETIEGVADRLLAGIRNVHCRGRVDRGSAHAPHAPGD